MHNLIVPQQDAAVRAELSRLMHAFFETVSFERDAPRYDDLHDLFIADAPLIGNSAHATEIFTLDAFIASRRGSSKRES